MIARAFNDASDDIEFGALHRELLVDGWQHDDPATGLVQAVMAYAPARSETGPRAAPGSRVPWRGSATVYLLDLSNDMFRLLAEATDQVLGPTGSPQTASLAAGMDRLGILIAKVDESLRTEILERLRWHARRARLLLEEERPDRRVPLSCPRCSDEMREHRVMMRPVDFSLSVYCTGCSATWGETELQWLGLLQESAQVIGVNM